MITDRFIDFGDTARLQHEIDQLRAWSPQGLRVAVVYGGLSAEDRTYLDQAPVEQLSVTALMVTLAGLGTDTQIVDPCQPGLVSILAGGVDVVLPNLHGPFGEDGRLQGLLDYLRVPYCGSSVAACAVAADKILTKEFMTGVGVPTPGWRQWAGPDDDLPWHGPVMVKPPLGGSSVGMSLVLQPGDLAPALQRATEIDPSPSPRVLVEDVVEGVPVTVGLLELPGGVLVLPPLATQVHGGGWYDERTKLDADGDAPVSLSPADLPHDSLSQMSAHARTLWQHLGCRGMARVDFMVDRQGHAQALEVNPTPSMASGSNFTLGAALVGLEHEDVVLAVLREGVTRRPYDVPLSPAPLGAASVGDR